MDDLTIIYYTSNRLPEEVAGRIRSDLLTKIGDCDIISVSHKPIGFGFNIVLGDNMGVNSFNIYRQILIGALAARTTYVACCEDDALYSESHFHHRPNLNCFAYDMNKFGVYTWHHNPMYSYKHRPCMWTCIAPRELLIKTLIERFSIPDLHRKAKWFGEPGRYDNNLGVTPRLIEEYKAECPSVVFSHLYALGADFLGRRKKTGESPHPHDLYWGSAKSLMLEYWGQDLWLKEVG
jgi:hypothetical protein